MPLQAHGSAETNDTIVAVGSPPGRSARGLLRISGPHTREIISQLTGSTPPVPRVQAACRLSVPPSSAQLPALIAFFPSPRSYTGQDMAELQCPGNPALLDRLVHGIVEHGARLAEPGEFTFRAFLAGKLDLTQAEGVAATIAATSDAQLQAATLLRQGKLGTFAADLVDRLSTQLALVESGIDFVDQDDVVPISPGRLHDNLAAIAASLDDLLGHSRSWSEIEGQPRVVLVGLPSTGKSTLFNALLGRQRAVVHPVPGTTRDVLSEPLTLRSNDGREFEVMLVDIAGLDEPLGALDEEVQAATHRAITRADLILRIHLAACGLASFTAPTIHVRTMIDILPPQAGDPHTDIAISAVTGQGIPELRSLIARHIGQRGVSLASQMLALQPRHEMSLRSASTHLDLARDLLLPQRQNRAIAQIELVAAAIRVSLDALACLGGRMTPDDVIGKVFATFCVGK